MLASLLLASCVPFVPLQTGGELAFPVGPADPGTVRVRIVDRNRVPLAHATVRGVFEAWDAAALVHGDEHAANRVDLVPAVTGTDGVVLLDVPERGVATVVVERPGFAPGSARPLFAGRAYELVLDFGAGLTVLVLEEGADELCPADVRVRFERFPQLPRGLRVERSGSCAGAYDVTFAPSGILEIEALAADGSHGRVRTSIASAWRDNGRLLEPAPRVVLRPTLVRTIPVTDREGRPIPGLEARIAGDVLGASVEVLEGAIRVRGIPPADERVPAGPIPVDPAHISPEILDGSGESHPLGVRLWAPGHRVVSLACAGEEPPSAFTFRYAAHAVRTVPPAAGELWTPLDPYSGFAWGPVRVTADATAELQAADDIPLRAPLVADGRVVAWLDEGAGAGDEDARWVTPATLVVRAEIDGHPLACGLVKLELVAVEGPIHPSLTRATLAFADPDGVCAIGGLFPGRWTVTLESHLVDHASTFTTVDLFEGETREVELEATRGRDVAGRIVDATGAAVGRGSVQVFGHDGTVTGGVYPVAEDGTFLATGLVDRHGYTLVWSELGGGPGGFFARELDGARARVAQVDLFDGLPDEIVIDADAEPAEGDDCGF